VNTKKQQHDTATLMRKINAFLLIILLFVTSLTQFLHECHHQAANATQHVTQAAGVNGTDAILPHHINDGHCSICEYAFAEDIAIPETIVVDPLTEHIIPRNPLQQSQQVATIAAIVINRGPPSDILI
jgi:hypothetical protein